MHIKTITFQDRRDFEATYACEHCNHEFPGRGYDDANFHQNVVPSWPCPECGKTAGDAYVPRVPKYPAGQIV